MIIATFSNLTIFIQVIRKQESLTHGQRDGHTELIILHPQGKSDDKKIVKTFAYYLNDILIVYIDTGRQNM